MKTAEEQLEAEMSEALAFVERAARLARKTGSADWRRIALGMCKKVARLAAKLGE